MPKVNSKKDAQYQPVSQPAKQKGKAEAVSQKALEERETIHLVPQRDINAIIIEEADELDLNNSLMGHDEDIDPDCATLLETLIPIDEAKKRQVAPSKTVVIAPMLPRLMGTENQERNPSVPSYSLDDLMRVSDLVGDHVDKDIDWISTLEEVSQMASREIGDPSIAGDIMAIRNDWSRYAGFSLVIEGTDYQKTASFLHELQKQGKVNGDKLASLLGNLAFISLQSKMPEATEEELHRAVGLVLISMTQNVLGNPVVADALDAVGLDMTMDLPYFSDATEAKVIKNKDGLMLVHHHIYTFNENAFNEIGNSDDRKKYPQRIETEIVIDLKNPKQSACRIQTFERQEPPAGPSIKQSAKKVAQSKRCIC